MKANGQKKLVTVKGNKWTVRGVLAEKLVLASRERGETVQATFTSYLRRGLAGVG